MSWRKKITVVMIPEASKPVRRLRLPRMFMVMIPSGILIAASLVVTWLYAMRTGYVQSTEAVYRTMEHQEAQFANQLREKDETIEAMQQEIIDLTEETEAIRDKLEQLKTIEADIKNLANLQLPAHPPPSPTTAPAGGQAGPIEPSNIRYIAFQTKDTLAALHEDLANLSDRLSLVRQLLQEQDYRNRITPSIWPTRTRQITSGYGYRRDPFTRKPSFHSGLDIEGDLGDPVFATAEGVVQEATWDDMHGNYILIRHPNRVHTRYSHLSKIYVKPDETVSKNKTIGLVGSTGRSTGPHLHYEVLLDGKAVDPKPYLKKQ